VGANVTIPHKQAALALSDRASPAAAAIGAANTLTFAPDGTIRAENTDAPGFLAALGVSPRGCSAQVLGAGGSARAVVWALREAGAREVSVWNRTPSRAVALARELGVRFVEEPVLADVLVNCTSVGLAPPGASGATGAEGSHRGAGAGESQSRPGAGGLEPGGAGVKQSASDPEALNLPGLAFDAVGDYPHVVDLVYSSSSAMPTPLVAAARAHGAHAVDGLEVLLAQGALSFERWTGREPPLGVMRRALLRS
jgi:shikimate dehydrogenase